MLATADVFTTALALLLANAGRLPRPDDITLVGQSEAREALAKLMAATGAKKALWDEALGLARHLRHQGCSDT